MRLKTGNGAAIVTSPLSDSGVPTPNHFGKAEPQ
jgi:hypothetical protein